MALSEINKQILGIVITAKSVSTRQIADETGLPLAKVHDRCSRMHEVGLLKRVKDIERKARKNGRHANVYVIASGTDITYLASRKPKVVIPESPTQWAFKMYWM